MQDEKITVMNDIRDLIQKTIKEKNLNVEEVIEELKDSKN